MRSSSRTRHHVTAVAAAALSTIALAGCGQPSAEPGPTTEGTVEVPTQPTLAPIDTALPTLDPSAPGSGGYFDAADALTGTSCARTGGTWSFTGTLTNSDDMPHTFTVAVSLVRTTDLSQVTLKEITVTVPAGASYPVEARSFASDPATGLQCVTGATVKGD
ncbi:MAG TPA: hypothetical protein VFJ94_01620 [Intrasporangium sp.]|uniref:hypothetical protein n=1 Tax=Intrasporangium sp. TaxID=1925024 RepID=UPI002D765423|nr:hypothetical protein [Intrasporangium sp.]HET7397192.1 hypothetical protein [Intrasporangium sp.]